MNTVGRFQRSRYRWMKHTTLAGYFVATIYNPVPMGNLLRQREPGRSVSAILLGASAPR